MTFRIVLTDTALNTMDALNTSDPKRLRRIQKSLGQLEMDPGIPGLNTHLYQSITGPRGEKVWESYVEKMTPAAYRLFWHYGPGDREITVFAITPHP